MTEDDRKMGELDESIKVSCHCGQVSLSVPTPPQDLGMCNCSICAKYGGLWAYYHPADVTLNFSRDSIDTYIWGDEMLQFCRCSNCGCLTHWEGIGADPSERMGVNARMMEGIILDRIPIRRIDGASF